MPKLAVNGGKKIRKKCFSSQSTLDNRETEAVLRVLRSKNLSGYRGNSSPNFMGGPEVRALETEWAEKFGTRYAIAVNSATSGLHIACGAIGLRPDDEVIVTPWSMSCSATAPMIWGARPVFADIERDHFCLDPQSIINNITEKTRAIIPVDLFGQAYDVEVINKIAGDYDLWIIEDACQAIGSNLVVNHGFKYESHNTGTFGDIGIFSLTTGKIISAGEGGMIVTGNEDLAIKCRLLRNHAEAVISDDIKKDQGSEFLKHGTVLAKLYGFNMRMTEIEAAIARVQLKKLDAIVRKRQANANYIYAGLNDLLNIRIAGIRSGYTHSYYVQPFFYEGDHCILPISKDVFINAVKAELTPVEGRESEGVFISDGYCMPLYRMPLFNHTIKNNPAKFPNCEALQYKEFFLNNLIGPNMQKSDLDDVIEAFVKVCENMKELI